MKKMDIIIISVITAVFTVTASSVISAENGPTTEQQNEKFTATTILKRSNFGISTLLLV